MPYQVGRANFNRHITPANTNMHARANLRVEAYAAAQARKAETAIFTDGVACYVWARRKGNIRCSCNQPFLSAPALTQIKSDSPESTTSAVAPKPVSAISPSYSIEGFDLGSRAKSFIDETTDEKITDRDQAEWEAKKHDAATSLEQLSSALTADNTELNHIPTSEDLSFLLSDNSNQIGTDFGLGNQEVGCPICAGTGAVDGYMSTSLRRIVLDMRQDGDLISHSGSIDDSQRPFNMTLYNSDFAEWQVTLPADWKGCMRIAAYNRHIEVYPTMWVKSDGAYAPLTVANLLPYKGTATKLTIRANNSQGGDSIIPLTHVEIILTVRDPELFQIAPLDAPYSSEWIDPDVELTAEFPSRVIIKEGDLVTESKYRRIWRLTNANVQQTALNSVHVTSCSMRSIQSSEFFAPFNLFN